MDEARCDICGMAGDDPDHGNQPHVFEPEPDNAKDSSQAWVDGCQAMREAIARRIEDVRSTLGVQMVVVTPDQIRETDIPFQMGRQYFIPDAPECGTFDAPVCLVDLTPDDSPVKRICGRLLPCETHP